MYRYIQTRLMTDFMLEFAPDADAAEQRQPPSLAAFVAQNEPPQQLGFLFASPEPQPSHTK